jgi:hypothetical protein
VQQLRIGMLHTRAWSALAACTGSKDPSPLLRVAKRAACRLEREEIPYVTAFARLIRAGAAAAGGEPARAAGLLREAAGQCDAAEMQLVAAAARWRVGELIGGDQGQELIRQADTWMRSQTIQDPHRIAVLYTPGFPSGA